MAASTPSDNIITSSGNSQVFESLRQQSLQGLNELIQLMLDKVDDAMYELSSKNDNEDGENKYFEAMRRLRLNRKNIEGKFKEFLQQSFESLKTNDFSAVLEHKTDELSLVDEDEIEVQIAITNMVNKVRPQFEDELLTLTERLKSLLQLQQIEDEFNPIDPKSVSNNFHLTIKDQEDDIEIRLILYKLYDKFVLSQFGDFYQHLNQHLISKGILPDLQAAQLRRDKRNSFKPKRDKAATPALDENLFDNLQNSLFPGQGDENGPGLPGVAHNPAYLSALSNLQFSGQQVAVVPVDSDPQQYKVQLQQQLSDFRQQHAEQAGKIDNQVMDIVEMLFDYFFEDDNLPDPIKVLIGRLQIPILKVAILDQKFFNSTEHPARQLLDSISRASLGWSKESAQEQLLIDKIEQIVDALLDEFNEDVGVFQQALEKFQQFLQQENQTVDINLRELQEQESQRDQQINQAQSLTDELVGKLLARYEFSPEVSDFFNGLWNQVMFNTCLTQGAESAQWENLKKMSSALIWTLIPKHNDNDKKKLLQMLPPLQRALTRGMELVKIDKQQQGEVFKILAAQHSSVVKQTSRNITLHEEKMWGGDSKMAEAMAKFNAARALEEQDDEDSQTESTQDLEVVDLAPVQEVDIDLIKEITSSDATEVISKLDEFSDGVAGGHIQLDEEIIAQRAEQEQYQQHRDEQADEMLQQAQELEIGDWVEFNDNENKTHNAKLSWKSNVTGKYVFVDRKGVKVRNITVYRLASELSEGQAKFIESDSVFERAINLLMKKKAA